jgi:AcrR family transcriptional regulator
VAEIAARAGVTERTFFRHFADKREVLFFGAGVLQELLVSSVAGAPATASPMDAVMVALVSACELLESRGAAARQRQAVISASVELREREVVKLAALASSLSGALRERGVGEPAASLTAEAGVAVFRVSFERWVDEGGARHLTPFLYETLDELRGVVTVE